MRRDLSAPPNGGAVDEAGVPIPWANQTEVDDQRAASDASRAEAARGDEGLEKLVSHEYIDEVASENAVLHAQGVSRWKADYWLANPEKARELRPELTPRQLRRLVRKMTRPPRIASFRHVDIRQRRLAVSRPHSPQQHRGSSRQARPGRRSGASPHAGRDGPSSPGSDPPAGWPQPFGRVDDSGILFIWRFLPAPSSVRRAVFLRSPEWIQRRAWQHLCVCVAEQRRREMAVAYGEVVEQ
jgi:hypothetical protein